MCCQSVGQRIVSLKYADRSSMSRPALLERVKLELELLRGLRLLLLCAAVFSIVIYASSIEKRSEYRLGLLVGFRKSLTQFHFAKLTQNNCRRIRTRARFLSTKTILLVSSTEV